MANDPPMAREVEELKASDLDALEKIAKAATHQSWAAFTDETGPHTNLVSFAGCTELVASLPGRAKTEPDIAFLGAVTPKSMLALIALARRSLPSPEAGGAETPTQSNKPQLEKEMRRAELGIDGNCGFALLGDNIQEGEAEFAEILPVSKWPDGWTTTMAECSAAKAALRKLKARVPGDYSFFFGRSHPYGN